MMAIIASIIVESVMEDVFEEIKSEAKRYAIKKCKVADNLPTYDPSFGKRNVLQRSLNQVTRYLIHATLICALCRHKYSNYETLI